MVVCGLLIAVASLFFFFNFYLFILYLYFWPRWVFVAARGLSLAAASGVYFLAVELGLLTAAAFLLEPGLESAGGLQ